MRLICQLCGRGPCSRGPGARSPAHAAASLLALLLASACGDDSASSTDASTGGSGTTEGSADTDTGTDSGSPTVTGATDEPGTSDPTATGGDPGIVGPNYGLLTFTLYAADAAGSAEQLGMAGAWRTEPFTTDDFHGVYAFGQHSPLAPVTVDTLELHEPQVYEWGKAATWVTLGNGVRLANDGGDALACLAVVADTYPVYSSDDAPIFDPSCAPDPAYWVPATQYDLVAYGGDAYDDEIVAAAVATPAALTVTAPAIDVFDFPLAKNADLALAWQADGGPDDRVIVRVWDQFGKQIVVHAADDGSHTIAGSELDKLAAGPATLTLAREHISELGLAAGTLRVVARHEVTAYPDLF